MGVIAAQLAAGVIAFVIAVAIIPFVNRWAREFSFLDMPDDDRRKHALPTPRLGGVAIFIAAIGATALVWGWNRANGGASSSDTVLWPGMLAAASIIFVTGLVDDLRGLGPVVKLLAQSSAALIVIGSGFQLHSITLTGSTAIDLGVLAIPLTILWIVGLTNALNLIDGVDGLAGTCALIGLMTAVAVQLMLGTGQTLVAVAATLGAVLAFLRYNNAPAKIFLGDAGSTTLGFYLSVQLIMSSTNARGWTYAIVPLFALAYPLVDTMVAIARRWLRGHPFSRADGRHIHHQLLAMGLSARRTVDVLVVVFFTVAAMGVSIAFAPPRVTLLLGVGVSILLLTTAIYGIRWLGYHEFTEFGSSVASVVMNARRRVRTKIVAGDVATRLESVGSVEELRQVLAESASELGFLEVSVETTAVHYVGPSDRQISPVEERPFRVDCPIVWKHADGSMQDAVVRFWCERPTTTRYVGAERIISRLLPAVQRWLNEHPAPAVPAKEVPHGRVSGSHRLSPIID